MYSINDISPNIGINGITISDAKRILNGYRFFFKVPIIATMTDDEIELFGVPVDLKPNGEIEYTANKRMTEVYYSLDRILDIYKNGHQIILSNRKDITKILEILSDVANKLEGGIVQVENDYIELIDDFINEVLQLNRKTVEHEHKQRRQEALKDTGLISGIELEDMNEERQVSFSFNDGIKVDQW